MIDTICLLIPKDKITCFTGESHWELQSKTNQYDKFVRNANKTEKNTGKYFPRLTGYTRRFSEDKNVRIEFSVPKLVYLNNLDELENGDFDNVIEILLDRLKSMGVIISRTNLENASISSIHFSKNIQLQDGYTVNHLISEMNKVNLRKSFDFAKTRYINDGQSLYAHATTHQLVIYDKIADMGKDKKRAIDKDQTLYQRSLFAEYSSKDELQEIIRFEARISSKQKLNKLLRELGYKENPTFREVFNAEISKKFISYYWEKIIKERGLGILSVNITSKDILRTIFLADGNIKPKQAIYLLGLFALAKDEGGIRQLRTIITKRVQDRTWYRITKDIQQASELITKNKLQDWVIQIDKALKIYKPYKIKHYEK